MAAPSFNGSSAAAGSYQASPLRGGGSAARQRIGSIKLGGIGLGGIAAAAAAAAASHRRIIIGESGALAWRRRIAGGGVSWHRRRLGGARLA